MPAIQLSRLNRQIDRLLSFFNQPQPFVRALHDLFEAYHDRTRRTGQVGAPPPLLPHYNLPLQVIRRVENEVCLLAQADSQAALALADALWSDDYLEPRLLGILILSQIPVDPPEAVIQRILTWARPDEDKQILQALLTRGTTRLRIEQTGLWANLSQGWLADTNPAIQAMGLHALLATAGDLSFENLPAVYRLISPLVQAPPTVLQGELLALLKILAERSPGETAYFLRQVVTINSSTQVKRLFRRCLPFFDEATQSSLRGAAYEAGQSPGATR